MVKKGSQTTTMISFNEFNLYYVLTYKDFLNKKQLLDESPSSPNIIQEQDLYILYILSFN